MNEISLPGGSMTPGRQPTSAAMVDVPAPGDTEPTAIESQGQATEPLTDASRYTSGPTAQSPSPADHPSTGEKLPANNGRTGGIGGAKPSATRPSIEKLEETVTKINDFAQSIQRELHFSIDDESGETIVKVVEKATNEVVRQIPAEDLMESLKNLNQNATSGVIISEQA